MIRWVAIVILISLGCSMKPQSHIPVSQGEKLFRSKCISCHSLPDTKRYQDSEWIDFMGIHGARSRLTEEESDIIVEFLLENKKM